jgi:hypothetical protein
MKKDRHYPYWAYSTLRGFKATKRRDAAAVERALNELRTGCAYVPNIPDEIDAVMKTVRAWRIALSVKEWGR